MPSYQLFLSKPKNEQLHSKNTSKNVHDVNVSSFLFFTKELTWTRPGAKSHIPETSSNKTYCPEGIN